MSEEPKPTPAPGESAPTGGPAAMPMVVNAQYVKDLSFENPHAPHIFLSAKEAPQVQLDVNVQVEQLAEHSYEVSLHMEARATQGADTAFLVDLAYAGVFTLSGIPAEHRRPLLIIEGARLLFPFARGIIAEITRDGGFPPLMIHPIDFADLYRRQVQTAAEGAGAGAAAAAKPH